ncbi:MAG: biopolymer transporter ExbD [Myxococcales bacterium]|nr:biopolymer transporter ExbD [Myxococcales bacterium]
MGMSLGDSGGKRRGGTKPVMNVTPLVDVVLVLLIIFMVVTPLLTKQLWLNVPPKPEESSPPPPPADVTPPIVITLAKDGVTKVNSEAIARDQLAARVLGMVNARPDKVVFFDAASDVPYGQALEVMDLVRGGGVETLAVLADELPTH